MLCRMPAYSAQSRKHDRASVPDLPVNWRNAPRRAVVASFAAFVVFLVLFHLAAYFAPQLREWTRMAWIAGLAAWGIGWYFQKKEAELEQHISERLARGRALPTVNERSREMRLVVKRERFSPGRTVDRPSEEMVG